MRFDPYVIYMAQRGAFKDVTSPFVKHSGLDGSGKHVEKITKNPHYGPPNLASSPAMLIQELPWNTGATSGTAQYVFDFSQTGPSQVPNVNNNIVLSKNNIFCCYGVQLFLGTLGIVSGNATSALTQYRSYGVLPGDGALYNSVLQMKIETSTYINLMEGQFFQDVPANSNEYYGEMGLQVINPRRILSGELGLFQFVVNLKNPMTGVVTSANTVISLRLHGVVVQARG
jgi:hypothetical protein